MSFSFDDSDNGDAMANDAYNNVALPVGWIQNPCRIGKSFWYLDQSTKKGQSYHPYDPKSTQKGVFIQRKFEGEEEKDSKDNTCQPHLQRYLSLYVQCKQTELFVF